MLLGVADLEMKVRAAWGAGVAWPADGVAGCENEIGGWSEVDWEDSAFVLFRANPVLNLGVEALKMGVNCWGSVGVFDVKCIAVSPWAYFDSFDLSRGSCKDWESFFALGFDVNSRVEMRASELAKVAAENKRNVKWCEELEWGLGLSLER